MKHIIFLSLISGVVFSHSVKNEVFSFKQLKFAWPCEETENDAIKSGQYIPENNVLLGAVRGGNKLFLTFPRWTSGAAMTLGYISLSASHGKTPRIKPYPDWESNTLPQFGCNSSQEHHLYSVSKCRVDDFDRLWCIDTGYQGIHIYNRTRLADPALVIYDLKTNCLVRRYTFKSTDVYSTSTLINIVLDSHSPDDVDAYVSDMDAMGLICYSFRLNDSWRIVHNFMYPDPLIAPFTLGDVDFTWPAGICAAFLSCDKVDGYRTLYFNLVNGGKLIAVSTKLLKNSTYANSIEAYHKFEVVGDAGPDSMFVGNVIDCDSGVMVTSQVLKYSISCWNTALPFNSCNIKQVMHDKEKVYAPDVTLDDEGYLWITLSPTMTFLQNGLCADDVNFRILKVSLKEATAPCLCSC